MNLENVLKELRDERNRLELAIAAMEQLALNSRKKRRGRPPKWLVEARKEERQRTGQRESRQ